MADPKIRIKRSAVAGRIPSVDQVPLGELALNTWDGQLYASKNVGLGTTVVAVNPWLVGTGTDSYNAYFTAGNIGIGSTTPTSALHVVGDAYVSGVVTANAGFNLGISSAGSVITSGPIKTLNFIGAGNTFLVNGTTVDISIQGGGGGAEIGVQANDSVIGYAQTTLNFAGTGVTGVSIGTTTTITIEPGLVGAAKSVTSFTATAGQTTFNVNYSAGQENVFLNGVRLSESQYTATNGSTVVLNDAASDGDSVDIVVYLRGSDPNRNVEVTLLPPFNGITTAFTMYKGSTSYLFDPIDERQIVVSLGGVIQQPGVAYTVGTGSSIFFSAAPGAATTCFITALYSNTVGVPTDAVFINKEVFNPTGVQTTFTIASGYTDSNIDIYRNGIRLVNGADYTATDGTTVDLVTPATGGDVVETVAYRTYIPPYFGNVKIGVGGTDLLVEGNARVTGILTVGPGSITFDGNDDSISIGTGGTALTFTNAGDLGISTTNPLQKVHVGAAATQSFVITSTGTIGIGTTNPLSVISPHYYQTAPTDSQGVRLYDITNNTVSLLGTTNTGYSYSGIVGHNTLLYGLRDITMCSDGTYSGNIKFCAGGSEKLRIRYNGGVTFNGDTADANALSDYEEGTFTPTLQGSTSNPSSVTYVTQEGQYVKVGKLVYININITISAYSGGSGEFQVGGLPFTSSSVIAGAPGLHWNQNNQVDWGTTGAISVIFPYIAGNTTRVRARGFADNLNNGFQLSGIPTSGTVNFGISGSYIAQ